ncbi:MAG TPA: branched-chain amino acid ABC transporter substrate-binding protein [Candidatus Limnocylindria bacterium]|nr:branched-chain amino acid ABC transporter substrate-binding protein [Candidatus Limnocylindria bacterium]
MTYYRWTAILAVLLLALAACSPTPSGSVSGSGAASASASGGATGDPETVCAEDEFGCVEVGDGEAIRIATALVINGPDSNLGLDAQYGVEVANEERPEIAGHEVELDFNDDGCSAEGGTTVAQNLASDTTIAAVIGTSCSSAGVPASEILSDAGVVLLSPSATAPGLTLPDARQPFFFRTAHNDEIQGAAMADFAYNVLGVKTAATIHDGGPYTEQLQQVFADSFVELGGEITGTEAVDPKATDVSGQLTSLAAGTPEFLFFPIFTQAGGQVARQAHQTEGLEDTILAGADGLLSPAFIEAAGAENAEGMYLSGPQADFGDRYQDEFLPAYTDVSGEEEPISAFHAHAYDAYNIIADAIEAVALEGDDGTLYIPRTALKDQIAGLSNYPGLTGDLTCNENGDCANSTITVREVREGEFVPIWNSVEGDLE